MSIHFARYSRRARRSAVFARCRRGATAVEYALLVALIGIAIIAGAKLVGTSVNDQLTDAGDAVVSLNPKAKPGKGGGGPKDPNPNKPTCPGNNC